MLNGVSLLQYHLCVIFNIHLVRVIPKLRSCRTAPSADSILRKFFNRYMKTNVSKKSSNSAGFIRKLVISLNIFYFNLVRYTYYYIQNYIQSWLLTFDRYHIQTQTFLYQSKYQFRIHVLFCVHLLKTHFFIFSFYESISVTHSCLKYVLNKVIL